MIIKARQLVFEGEAAQIDTTPIAVTTRAADFLDRNGKNVRPGQPGLDGQAGGDVYLHVLDVQLGESGVREGHASNG